MLELLEHIDDIERLGLGYVYQCDIRRAPDIITSIYELNVELEEKEVSLHEASLRFRILRQHGYNVRFKDSQGGFIGCLKTDVKGLLSLYEASHLAFMEERDLHEAKLFAREHLLKLKGLQNDPQVLEHINQALEVPLCHRMPRLQARYYIDAYNKRQDANLLLQELATLDFNMTQAAFKTELKEVSKWWENLGLAHKLGFVRDRLMECFFWTIGVVSEPQYHSCHVKVKDVVESLEKYHDLMKWSSVVFRLYNDLATSSDEIERGKTVNAISCYMHENGVCEEVARAYLTTLIDETWRNLIKVHVACSQELRNQFINTAINLARISCCTYQYGDGHGAPDARAKNQVLSVIIEPITVREKEHKCA
ncbi:hypothetical protein L1987_43673 [Smallanthus sonchifolius]|uniref:Uncharacterized protein n=1 Tax=Smallanthus sonchifolius TaxID=185202 RepID=A0ACB9GPB8_9ASTR|nr:hypothetical protein L1987_43673 [Smallanthus sonchifolius]